MRQNVEPLTCGIKRSATTTSASWIARSAATVRSSGWPGPAPTSTILPRAPGVVDGGPNGTTVGPTRLANVLSEGDGSVHRTVVFPAACHVGPIVTALGPPSLSATILKVSSVPLFSFSFWSSALWLPVLAAIRKRGGPVAHAFSW
jgi:hypothetical protein